MYKQLDSAIAFAATAHAGQLRKYDGLPYVVHPIAVMQILHQTAAVVTEDQLVAAVLHDVVEDTPVSIETIERRFGATVAALVFDLTDQFVFPNQGNRKVRKQLERQRLATISPAAQDIKLADLIHNTMSITEHDPGFARVYLDEKEAVLGVLTQGDEALRREANRWLGIGQSRLLENRLGQNNPDASAGAPAPRLDSLTHGPGTVPGLGGVASIAR